MWDLTYALAEEIGDPDLFVGRKQELARLMKWAEGAKRRISLSTGILSRRKKGKTALLQRFFNILYTRDDPQLIPFYYRVRENRLPKRALAEQFYRSLLSQYFAFTTRTPELVGQVLSLAELRELAATDRHVAADLGRMEDTLERSPDLAWDHAQDAGHRISQLNDVRILQILDEFQYMNRWVVSDRDEDRVELLCHSYMGTAESKFSPQLVAGSYIGWSFAASTARRSSTPTRKRSRTTSSSSSPVPEARSRSTRGRRRHPDRRCGKVGARRGALRALSTSASGWSQKGGGNGGDRGADGVPWSSASSRSTAGGSGSSRRVRAEGRRSALPSLVQADDLAAAGGSAPDQPCSSR